MKNGIVAVFLAIFLSISVFAVAQEQTRIASGKISAINKLHNTITVKWMVDPTIPTYNEAQFIVDKNTNISKGSRSSMRIDGLNVGDTVLIRYIRAGDAKTDFPKAVYISVRA